VLLVERVLDEPGESSLVGLVSPLETAVRRIFRIGILGLFQEIWECVKARADRLGPKIGVVSFKDCVLRTIDLHLRMEDGRLKVWDGKKVALFVGRKRVLCSFLNQMLSHEVSQDTSKQCRSSVELLGELIDSERRFCR
jgi:hypothetical protein